MGDVLMTADALVDLAMATGQLPLTRTILLAAERADVHGVALFNDGELVDLLNEDVPGRRRLSNANAAHKVRMGCRLGRFLDGDLSRIVVNTEHYTPTGWSGLRVIHDLRNGRAVAECRSGHRATYVLDRVWAGTATCGRCSR